MVHRLRSIDWWSKIPYKFKPEGPYPIIKIIIKSHLYRSFHKWIAAHLTLLSQAENWDMISHKRLRISDVFNVDSIFLNGGFFANSRRVLYRIKLSLSFFTIFSKYSNSRIPLDFSIFIKSIRHWMAAILWKSSTLKTYRWIKLVTHVSESKYKVYYIPHVRVVKSTRNRIGSFAKLQFLGNRNYRGFRNLFYNTTYEFYLENNSSVA